MKQEDLLHIKNQLQNISAGQLTIAHHTLSAQDSTLFLNQFLAKTKGKGKVEAYVLFPGIEASYNIFCAPEVAFRHKASSSILELFYCHSGRVGWHMKGETEIYLGAGDMTAHSSTCCADSAMMFPLGYAEGISFSVDFQCLETKCPEILKEANIDLKKLKDMFCSEKPVSIPACPETDGIFIPLYSVPSTLRMPYLKLKIQELLLYLHNLGIKRKEQTQYFSQQTELIKEIHSLLTEHLDHRFTIEDLSKRYLLNTSTIKEVFKGVYGLPIARYMKEFRIRKAMELLRDTNDSIAIISRQVGYESQSKFTKTFKDITQTLPSEYRKKYRISH